MLERIWRRARFPEAPRPARTTTFAGAAGPDPQTPAARPAPEVEGDPVLYDMGRLDAASSVVHSYLHEPFSSCAVLVNPLLGLWDAAHEIDPAACSPVEELLTVLLQRSIISSAEVMAVIDDVRARAIQGSVLAHSGGR